MLKGAIDLKGIKKKKKWPIGYTTKIKHQNQQIQAKPRWVNPIKKIKIIKIKTDQWEEALAAATLLGDGRRCLVGEGGGKECGDSHELIITAKWVMLHIIPLSSFCPPKIDVALKITIEFLIYHYWILIQW
jgi:hypothetical protein